MENKKSYGTQNDLNLKLVIALSRATTGLHRGASRNMKENGLTPSQFEVLEVLYHKGAMKVNEIKEKILASSGNMTVILANLEKDGYIGRIMCKTDRRAFILEITEKGKEVMDRTFPLHIDYLDDALKNLDESEKRDIIRLLKKMQGLGGIDEDK
ncbi:MarR family winged helix-turn-helix transcriptional regulator [Youngiibacter multivorans]|uniref:DNA-binding MarR family transcriptional regulator n=1 Tax=Youngiibacter multivorans TaxID=937251 RepID=A0ABS4FZH7_9CLOT|nr:MarR family transcriptional regulator [Youngiibacter multivorans]MBP1917711.1 DNA-binding MarR family transcriptional regulator [Youngiibacter multivorans]